MPSGRDAVRATGNANRSTNSAPPMSRSATIAAYRVLRALEIWRAGVAMSGNFFQRMLRAASYGGVDYPTIPGCIIKRDFFHTVGGFKENVRAGEDIEWRERLTDKGQLVGIPEASVITYKGLKNDLASVIKKYFISGQSRKRQK